MEESEKEQIKDKKKKSFLGPSAFEEIIINKNINFDDNENLSNKNSISENKSYNSSDFNHECEFNGIIRENNPINLLTSQIVKIFKKCQKEYNFEENKKPIKQLTKPSEGVYNNNNDNENHDLIVNVDDIIKGPNYEYIIIDLLGEGVSGQVFKCKRIQDEKLFAIKIIKNTKILYCNSLKELRILELLNNEVDKNDDYHIIRKIESFTYKDHLCIVLELLNESLYQLLEKNFFNGLSLSSIRFILKQILEALLQLQKLNIIHCDIKPENILLKVDKENKNEILAKITDFGSATFKNSPHFQYIQTRYYRAPETIIGFPYSLEIDMWSLGCIAAELYLGQPLFAGSSSFDQLEKIINFIGELPYYMLKKGKFTKKFYSVSNERDDEGKFYNKFNLKTIEEYFIENPDICKPKYTIPGGLKDLDDILTFQSKKNLNHSNNSISQSSNHCNELEAFVHFLKGLLAIDPQLRWNAKTALRHPFILKQKFDGNFSVNQNDEISMFCNNQSFETSFLSDGHQNNMNFNMNLRQQNQNNFNNNFNRNFSDKNLLGQNTNIMNINNFHQYNQMQNNNLNQKNKFNNYNNFPIQNNLYRSMVINPNSNNSIDNESLNSVNNQFQNSSMEYSNYQPNICNIPLKMLKNFPYGKIDKIDLKSANKHAYKEIFKNKNANKFNQNPSQTFTVDNFNKLGSNSFTHDTSHYNHNQNLMNYNQVNNNFHNMNFGGNNNLNISNDR